MNGADHIHTPDDGRGAREVFIDGKLLKHVVFADTKRGVVRVLIYPFEMDKHKKRVLTRTLRGKVEVRQTG